MSAVIEQDRRLAAPAQERPDSGGAGGSLKKRLYGLVGVAVLAVVLVLAWSINLERGMLLNAKRAELSSVAQNALSVVDYYYGLQQQGKLSEQDAKAAAQQTLQNLRYGGPDGRRDYVLAIDTHTGTLIVHGGNAKYVGSSASANAGDKRDPMVAMRERMNAIQAGGGRAFNEVAIHPPGGGAIQHRLNIYLAHQPWGWIVGTGVMIDDLHEVVMDRIISGIVAAVVAAAVLGLVGMLFVRAVVRQIGTEPVRLIDIMQTIARGDLRAAVPDAPPASLAGGLARMTGAMRELIARVRIEAAAMRRDAQRIAETAGEVSATAANQSEAASSMAAAVEELTVSVAHISSEAAQTQEEAEGAAAACQAGEEQVLRAADSMKRIASAVSEASDKIKGLEERAAQISSIAASIKEIAGQTNLLALNAAIEAARAGEQGRGFSVVADEVRKLAERTASATVEIEDMVGAVQRETAESTATMSHILPMVAEGNELADQVAVALRQISSNSNSSVSRVRGVAHATKEQSAASTAISQQVENIAQMVEETSTAMQATARSADDIRGLAERLDTLVNAFKV